jgi:hypothetical protein
MVGWEYCQGLAGYDEVVLLLNRLGEQGWELVQVLPTSQYLEIDRRTHFDKIQYFMKHPIPTLASGASEEATQPAPVMKTPVRLPRL